MKQPSPVDPSYLIVSTLFRTLTHKLRGPLSVISNDLSFLQTTTSDEGCERGILRCREISELLGEISLPFQPDITTIFDIISVLEDCRFETLNCSKTTDLNLSGNRELLCLGAGWLRDLLSEQFKSSTIPAEIVTPHQNMAGKIRIDLTDENSSNLNRSVSFGTATELFCLHFKQDLLYPPLIDCIMRLHDITLLAELSADRVRITLELPHPLEVEP